MVLTGEVGTGKTTLINALKQYLPGRYLVANISHNSVTSKGMIQSICREYDVPYAGQTQAELIFKLDEHLRRSFFAGRKCILILDEAQNLKDDVLEEIRLLSNFEGHQKKYLQMLLVGQPELDAKLDNHKLRQLRDRISFHFRLRALSRTETKLYIHHRLTLACKRSLGSTFTDDALDRIFLYSKGVPRQINILCNNALLCGYAKNSLKIDSTMVENVIPRGTLDDWQSAPNRISMADANATTINLAKDVNGQEAHGPSVSTVAAVAESPQTATASEEGERNGYSNEDLERIMVSLLEKNNMSILQRTPLILMFSMAMASLVFSVTALVIAVMLIRA